MCVCGVSMYVCVMYVVCISMLVYVYIHCVIYSQELEWFLISRMFENFSCQHF